MPSFEPISTQGNCVPSKTRYKLRKNNSRLRKKIIFNHLLLLYHLQVLATKIVQAHRQQRDGWCTVQNLPCSFMDSANFLMQSMYCVWAMGRAMSRMLWDNQPLMFGGKKASSEIIFFIIHLPFDYRAKVSFMEASQIKPK